MAKTNSTFKIGKMVKLLMGATFDPIARRIYKNAMIDAQQSYVVSKTRKYTELKSNPNPRPQTPSTDAS